jgi:hypothetical protein
MRICVLTHVEESRMSLQSSRADPRAPTARIFVPQEALESWVAEGRAQLLGETLLLEGVGFSLTGAVHFVSEVAGGGDEPALVGKVKTLSQLAELGGEHCAASVVLGDNAYEVVEGFVAQPEQPGTVPHARLIQLFSVS